MPASRNKSRPQLRSNMSPPQAITQEEQAQVSGSFKDYVRIFKYAGVLDATLYGIAICASIVVGATGPLMTLAFGRFTTTFNGFVLGTSLPADFIRDVDHVVLMLVALFAAKCVLAYLANVLISIAATNVTCALRSDYLRKTLHQEISHFDKDDQAIATHLTTGGDTINLGVGEKLSSLIQGLSTFFAAIIVALTVSWRLALMTLSLIPAWLTIVALAIPKDTAIQTRVQHELYLATDTAQDAFKLIRTVRAFGAELKLIAKHHGYLDAADKAARPRKLVYGVLYAAQAFITSCIMVIAIWQGYRLFEIKDIESSGPVFTVLFSVCMANGAIQQLGPHQQAVANACVAATALLHTIDRPLMSEAMTEEGHRSIQRGKIEVRDVVFAYPQRPAMPVLNGLSVLIPARQTTALVGQSGCGKSTVLALLERWYEVGKGCGSITIDGTNISHYNTRWLRGNIGLVQQEAVLFAGTVFDNVAMGFTNDQSSLPKQEQRHLVAHACRQADAHDFIMALPWCYDTGVGERGNMLSGGQRQRIAIARAIVSDPKILLLDEATSALDPATERVVQAALDKISKNRTTIVIAHRLSSIKSADNIIVLADGAVAEKGTHSELISKGGRYAAMARAQDLNLDRQESSANRRDSDSTFSFHDLPDSGREHCRASLYQDDHGTCKKDTFDEKDAAFDREDKKGRMPAVRGRISKKHTDPEAHDASEHVLGEGMRLSLLNCFLIMLKENRQLHGTNYMILAFSAVIGGAATPIQAILFARLNDAFVLPAKEGRQQANMSALMFLVIAFATGLSYFCVAWTGHGVGQQLASRYRRELFDRCVRMDQEFFDLRHVSTLTSKLNDVPAAIQELLSSSMIVISLILVTLVASCILGIVWGWKLGLVLVFGGLPPLIGAGYVKIWCEDRYVDQTAKHFASSAALAIESTAAIRTIVSLTVEDKVIDQYNAAVREDAKKSTRFFLFASMPYAMSQSLEYLILALGFWYGSRLLVRREYTTEQFLVIFTAIIFAGQAAATFFTHSNSLARARSAVNYVLWLRTVKGRIQETAMNMDRGPIGSQAEVEFDQVSFAYRNRPTVPVLQHMDFKIDSGQYVAFVGPSGSGKSTIISLLQRFYDPISGRIMLNEQAISSMSPKRYRSHISLVQQEPMLFQGSIRDNITIGLEDEPSEGQLREALQIANCLDFVMSLPEGLETACGNGGSQLSGGQRQRISMARAVIRKSQMLLLDEATSALDAQSERLIQESLERARLGRTVVAIAHRLSTVRNASVIFVVAEGKILESGTHETLLKERGLYFTMCLAQSIGMR
ncbi:hypothetical protein BST61_g6096 [Cercospora zeina]